MASNSALILLLTSILELIESSNLPIFFCCANSGIQTSQSFILSGEVCLILFAELLLLIVFLLLVMKLNNM